MMESYCSESHSRYRTWLVKRVRYFLCPISTVSLTDNLSRRTLEVESTAQRGREDHMLRNIATFVIMPLVFIPIGMIVGLPGQKLEAKPTVGKHRPIVETFKVRF